MNMPLTRSLLGLVLFASLPAPALANASHQPPTAQPDDVSLQEKLAWHGVARRELTRPDHTVQADHALAGSAAALRRPL